MTISRSVLPGIVVLGSLAGPSVGAELGDPAAPLRIAEWVKGGPVDLAKDNGKTIHVIEFWATWCPPCRMSIPHLTELQKKYKDKGVVLVSVTDESPNVVRRFVQQQGDRMDYVVAVDDKRITSAAYMRAFGQGSIPYAFVIDKKDRIIWHGHPLAGLDEVVEQVVSGEYDLEKAKKVAEAEKKMLGYFELVMRGKDIARANKLGQEVVADGGSSVKLMDQFAWAILATPQLKHRDLKLARKAAKAGYDACDGKNASMVDTYARALFDSGDVAEAVELQRQAVKLAGDDPRMRAEYSRRLLEYEAKAARLSKPPT